MHETPAHPPPSPQRARHSAIVAAALLLAVGACAGADPDEATPAREAPAAPPGPWTLEPAAPAPSDGLSILVLHDMEGLSGEDDWRYFSYSQELYAAGQELLVADVNAVIDGLFAGGATEVHVVDGHGSGNPEPDIRADLLDPRASQVLRDEPFDTYFDLPESGASYDAVAVVGMHSKTGSGGFAAHTFTLGIEFQIHGQPITETELVGLSWGRFGVPVIFGSGDDRLAADLATMPWIEFVTVKTATSASTVELRPVEEARADLREGARRAVESLVEARVMKVATPVEATLRAVPPATLAMLEGVPDLDYSDGSVTFVADDLRSAYDGLTALVGVARAGYSSVLDEVIRSEGLGDRVFPLYGPALMERWLDVESGRYEPPTPSDGPAEDRRYHGYR